MKKVTVLKCDDWEMLYVNDELVNEGHTLNEGIERVIYFLTASDHYGFNLEWIEWKYLTQEDYKILSETGRAPKNIKEFKGEY